MVYLEHKRSNTTHVRETRLPFFFLTWRNSNTLSGSMCLGIRSSRSLLRDEIRLTGIVSSTALSVRTTQEHMSLQGNTCVTTASKCTPFLERLTTWPSVRSLELLSQILCASKDRSAADRTCVIVRVCWYSSHFLYMVVWVSVRYCCARTLRTRATRQNISWASRTCFFVSWTRNPQWKRQSRVELFPSSSPPSSLEESSPILK